MERELGRFGIAIKLFLDNEMNIKYKFDSLDLNIPKEMIITQLRTFIKILEEDYYPDFKDNITTISGKPEN